MSKPYVFCKPDCDVVTDLLAAMFPGGDMKACRLGPASFDVLIDGADKDGHPVLGWLPLLALERAFPGWADSAEVPPVDGIGGTFCSWKRSVLNIRRAAVRLLTYYVVPRLLFRRENSISSFSGDGAIYMNGGEFEPPETWLIDDE